MAIFLAGSALAHATLLGMLPGFMPQSGPPPVTLEVALLEARPLPVAPPAPEPPLKPPVEHKIGPPHKAKPRQPASHKPERQAPMLALPAIEAPGESGFTVPAVRKPLEAPAQAPQVASVAITPPAFNAEYLRNPAPRYPLAARRFGEQGTVLLRVTVSADGLPSRVELEKTSGSVHLDNAAIEAVKGWRFTPARRGNEPVEGRVLVPIVFRLEG